jgi:tellurite resistance protein TerC
VLVSLFIDFVVLKKQGAHDIGVKEALNWSLIWIALSFLFNGLFWWAVKDSTGSVRDGQQKSLEFLTGYLIEKVAGGGQHLRVPDDLHLLRGAGGVPEAGADDRHHRRHRAAHGHDPGGRLAAGQFHWILYVFGAFLILTGVKMWWAAGKEPTWTTTRR